MNTVQASLLEQVGKRNGTSNKLLPEDRAAHDWYRFVLSYPPHLVRDYLTRFGVQPGQTVLDPFCGTGPRGCCQFAPLMVSQVCVAVMRMVPLPASSAVVL